MDHIFFCFYPVSHPMLLVGAYHPLMFNVIIDMYVTYVFISILLFSDCFVVFLCSFLFHLKRPYNTFCKNSVLINSLYCSLFEKLFISLFILSDNLVE